MKTAAVVIEAWKLPVFKKHFDAAGYKYTIADSKSATAAVLRVEYEWVASLQPIVEAAQDECRRSRKP